MRAANLVRICCRPRADLVQTFQPQRHNYGAIAPRDIAPFYVERLPCLGLLLTLYSIVYRNWFFPTGSSLVEQRAIDCAERLPGFRIGAAIAALTASEMRSTPTG